MLTTPTSYKPTCLLDARASHATAAVDDEEPLGRSRNIGFLRPRSSFGQSSVGKVSRHHEHSSTVIARSRGILGAYGRRQSRTLLSPGVGTSILCGLALLDDDLHIRVTFGVHPSA